MLAGADTHTIRAREVCCIDSTARDVGYNRQLEAGGGSGRTGGARGGRGGQMTRLLLSAMKRSLVGGILVCLLESKRKRNRGKRERERRSRRGGGRKERCQNKREK